MHGAIGYGLSRRMEHPARVAACCQNPVHVDDAAPHANLCQLHCTMALVGSIHNSAYHALRV